MQLRFTFWALMILFSIIFIACKKHTKDVNSETYTVSTFAGGNPPVPPSGGITPTPGIWHADGPGSSAIIFSPQGITVDPQGNVYISDASNHIRKITPAGDVSTVAGNGKIGTSDGQGITAEFRAPEFLSIDAQRNLYASRPDLRKITPTGVVTTLARNTGSGSYQDGPIATAKFGSINGTAIDGQGTIYVADGSNHRIRKITHDGMVSTLAGSGPVGGIFNGGYKDGPGNTAMFENPGSIAIDGQGNLYVTEWRLSGISRNRKITPEGGVSTILFDVPGSSRVIADKQGNLFITANTRVFKIIPSGQASLMAGSIDWGYANGDGSKARFSTILGIALDEQGNLYVTDHGYHAIRKISKN